MQDFGLYIVMTEPAMGYELFTEICSKEEVPMLQLRDKKLTDRELIVLIERLKGITRGSRTKLLLNDRADLASLGDLDGLHLGPEDLPWQMASSLLPREKIIGVSTHSITEARELISHYKNEQLSPKPDYMSFGPIYPTPAKAKPDSALGTEALREIVSLACLPLVAIGGIFPHNLPEVLAAGARNIAMIRHFSISGDTAELKDKIKHIKHILQENLK